MSFFGNLLQDLKVTTSQITESVNILLLWLFGKCSFSFLIRKVKQHVFFLFFELVSLEFNTLNSNSKDKVKELLGASILYRAIFSNAIILHL